MLKSSARGYPLGIADFSNAFSDDSRMQKLTLVKGAVALICEYTSGTLCDGNTTSANIQIT